MKLGVCKHYRGPCVNETCHAGVHFRGLVGEEDVLWGLLPCNKANRSDVECKSGDFPTREEVDEYNKEVQERHNLLNAAYVSCAEDAPKQGFIRGQKGARGTVECPKCGKPMNYTIAASNGHIWAKCTTEGCLAMIQ